MLGVDRDKFKGGPELEKQLAEHAQMMLGYANLEIVNQRSSHIRILVTQHNLTFDEAVVFCQDKPSDIIETQLDRMSSAQRQKICIYCRGVGQSLPDLRKCAVCKATGTVEGRPNWDVYFMSMLPVVRSRASCSRRQVGAIITDSSNNLISTGYNGPPSAIQNCTDKPCGAEMAASGDTSLCLALHAEHNAIYFAGDRKSAAHNLYTSCEPCDRCALEILQTPIKRVVYEFSYPSRGREILLDSAVELIDFADLLKNEKA